MPVWTFEELLEADSRLNLDLGNDTLAQRFHLFGGSARFCLATNDVIVMVSGERLLKSAD